MRESVKRFGKIGRSLRTSTLGCCVNILAEELAIDSRCGREDSAFSTTISFVGLSASSNGVSGMSICGTTASATVNRREATASRFDIVRRKNIEVCTRLLLQLCDSGPTVVKGVNSLLSNAVLRDTWKFDIQHSLRSWKQCMQLHSQDYSLVGAYDLVRGQMQRKMEQQLLRRKSRKRIPFWFRRRGRDDRRPSNAGGCHGSDG